MRQDQGRQGAIAGFRDGVLLLGEGFRFLRAESRLWLLAVVPVVFATILMAAAIALFIAYFDSIYGAWGSLFPVLEAEVWWAWIWVGPGKVVLWLVGWLGVIVAFAFSIVAALLVANLASAPFLDLLSQRVEAIASGGRAATALESSGFLIDTLRSFRAEFLRLAFLSGLWIVLSLAGFIVPGAHIVTGPLLIGLTLLFLPLDYAGFALDRRLVSFRSRRRWLTGNLPTMIGFGGVAFVACLIPGLNLLIMPALVTAGTLLVVRREPVTSRPEDTREHVRPA